MPQAYRYVLHSHGPALWPTHKREQEVLELRATTPNDVWEATYQGNPTPPGGAIFKRSWWAAPGSRYDASMRHPCVARWLSFDTGLKAKESSDYTACVAAELWSDYRLALTLVYRDKLTFDDLPDTILRLARQMNGDGLLRGVLIEDKVSGTSAYQTLTSATAEPWIAALVQPFIPQGDKVVRAKQASVWCSNGSVLLPIPSASVPWLLDFEDELFTFPGGIHDDQVDAFDQVILYTENLLAEGWRFRTTRGDQYAA